jgi:hypothetical protein
MTMDGLVVATQKDYLIGIGIIIVIFLVYWFVIKPGPHPLLEEEEK